MLDERLNLPSASAMERIALCPGSRKLEASVPDKRTADSQAGDRAHDIAARYFDSFHAEDSWPTYDAMAQGEDIEAADVVGQFIEMAHAVFLEWKKSIECDAPLTRLVEVRLTMFADGINALTTGKPDVVWICGQHALILDLKSLYGHHTTSVKNLQLRTYAALVNEDQGASYITVAICQPRVSSFPQLCYYNPLHLRAAQLEIQTILDTAAMPDAPLVAGASQCKNCRARAVCPAARDFAAIIPLDTDRVLASGEAGKLVALLPISEQVKLWSNASTIKKILDAVTDNLLDMPADILAEAGLEVVVSKGYRMIKDPSAAYESLKEDLTEQQFRTATTVGITKLLAVYRAATQLTAKAANTKLEETLGDNLSRKADGKALNRLRGGPRPREVIELRLEPVVVPQLEDTIQ